MVSGPTARACIFSALADSLPSDEDALLVLEAFADDPPRRPHGVLVGIPTLTQAGAHRTNVLLSKLPPHWGRVVIDNGGHMAGHPSAVPARPSVAASWNYALGVAERLKYEITLLLNDDIVISRQGLEDLALEGAASYRRFLRNPKSQPVLVGAEPHAFAAFVMHAGLVARVGYFDEGFVPAYYEDTDYVRRLDLVDGYVAKIDVGAKHEAATTSRELGKKWEDVATQSRAHFEKKWGRAHFEKKWGRR